MFESVQWRTRAERRLPATTAAPGYLCDLDVKDTTTLKGLAIVVIVLHNFFHLVSPARENEFSFHPDRIGIFFRTVVHPQFALQALFSFFGHYGVSVFVMLSAYGLAKSHWDPAPRWMQFMASRVRKLYPTFLLIVLAWFAAAALEARSLQFIQHVGLQLLLMLAGVSNAMHQPLPPVGPWWFIPFVIQLYALWPMLRWITVSFGRPGLIAFAAVCVVFTYAASPGLAHWSINLMETPIGRMPVVVLGIITARYPWRIYPWMAPLAAVFVLLASRYYGLWLLSFPAALILVLSVYLSVREVLRNFSLLQWAGDCSLLVFLLNTLVRNEFVGFAVSPMSQILFAAFTVAGSFVTAALILEALPSLRLSRRRSMLVAAWRSARLSLQPVPQSVLVKHAANGGNWHIAISGHPVEPLRACC